MMVKKKLSETQDDKGINNTETTENKDIEKKTTADQENQVELAEEEKSEEKATESIADEEPVSDKKIPEEKQLIEKLAEMQDKYLRLSAEFDNFRKRTLKEKMEMSKYAGEELLKEILPFMDDFERALKHLETSENCIGIKEGIDLIYVKLSEFLKLNGVKEIESLNSGFNLDLHDAVAKVHVDEEEKKGKVVEVVLKGYYLKDKVLRHSKVVIGE
jgi:molecular chaperone GrpE